MPDHFDAKLADLVQGLHHDEDMNLEQAMASIVEFARDAVGVTDGSIFLAHPTPAGPLYDTVVPTSPVVIKVDELQHEVQQGPSLDAIASDDTVLCPDLTADERWPLWRVAAADVGVGGVISARLRSRGRTIGALNFYTREPNALGAEQAQAAELLAKHAAAALAAAMDHASLLRALLSRSVIARAQGLLMERYSLTEGRAFELMKRYSQATNTKLRDIAERLVAGERLDAIVSLDQQERA